MVEKSVFSNVNELKEWVQSMYHISCIKIDHLNLGSANCFYLEDSEKTYFLKEFQSKVKLENIRNEIDVCEYLNQNGIPTSKFLKNINGEYVSHYRDKYIHIQGYIDGKAYDLFDMPDEILFESARLLAKINRTLKDYKEYSDSFGDEWLADWDNRAEIDKLENLLANAIPDLDDQIGKKIKEDFAFKISVLKGMDGYGKRFLGSYKCNSHGDYSTLQILCKNKKIVAIIDFSAVCHLPVTWELIRSYSYGAGECRNVPSIDFAKFKAYIDAYLSENKIPLKDIQLMPYLYFFNLSRSTFGYKQYLTGNMSDPGLLQFGFWRTNMCKWLYENMDDLSEYLTSGYAKVLE